MTERDDQLAKRLAAIEERLARLEEQQQRPAPSQRADLVAPAQAPAPPPPAPTRPIPPAPTSAPPPARTPPTPAPSRTEPASASPPHPTPTIPRADIASALRRMDDVRKPPQPPPQPRKPAASSTPIDFEKLIGGRWYAVAGGLVVIIGVAMFFQYAWRQGWLQRIPAGVKCGAGAVFGAILLAAAEFLRRRVNAWAAVGLNAAGLGAIYVSAWAAWARFDLVPPPAAFVMLAACAALGVFIGARAKLAAVSIISLIGAYLAPFLIDRDPTRAWVMPPYWMALLVIALTLSAWRGGAFTAVRWIAWWATLFFGAIWSLSIDGKRFPEETILFLGAVWLAVHVEHWLSARREDRALAQAIETGAAPRFSLGSTAEALHTARSWAPILSSFALSAWAVWLGVLVVRAWGRVPDWLPPAGGAGATLLAGLALAGNLRVLRDAPDTAAERLGAALAMQAGALLIAAVALGLSGSAEVIAWVGMGAAGIAAGRWMASRAVNVYGLILLTIATARLLTYDLFFGNMTAGAVSRLGLSFSQWSLMAALTAAGWIAAAAIFLLAEPKKPEERAEIQENAPKTRKSAHNAALRRRRAREALIAAIGRTALAIGLTLLALAPLIPEAQDTSRAAVALTLALALFAAGTWLKGDGVRMYACFVLFGAMWQVAALQWWDPGESPAALRGLGLVFTQKTPFLLYAAIVCFIIAIFASPRNHDGPWRPAGTITAAVGAITLMALFFHEMARNEALIIVWALISILTVAASGLHRRLALERTGAGLLIAPLSLWLVAFLLGTDQDARVARARSSETLTRWSETADPLLLHRGLWLAFGLAAICAVFGEFLARRRLPRASDAARAVRFAGWTAAAAMIFLATSLEAARVARDLTDDPAAQYGAISLWWGVFAIILLISGFALRLRAPRRAGLTLLAAATGKALIYDLQSAPLGWRVISVLALGLLMLAVGVIYARLAGAEEHKQIKERENSENSAE